jgi:hypothetical protein
MQQTRSLTRVTLKTPRAAGIAGIIFSVLLLAIFGLLRILVPIDPLDRGSWLPVHAHSVGLALNLVPFAGIAFLWFIGVIRDRLGGLEDRFFATVFLGSALLFLAMLFAAAAVGGALVLTFAAQPAEAVNSPAFQFGRATAYSLMNVYAIKAAAVFMISTSTVAFCTHFVARWIAVLGFGLALVLLVGSYYLPWSFAVLPIWVSIVSIHILIDAFRQSDHGLHESRE